MRPVEDLINKKDPGWVYVKEWIDSAKNKVEVLPCDSNKSKVALYKVQVTTRSPMGAIIYMTGGLLIDDGWIRILGSGHPRLNRSLPDWNRGKSFKEFGETTSFLLIADDAIGGFFAINGGAFGKDLGKVYYLSPDNLEWEALDLTYTNFLSFCFSGDIASFYEAYRWRDWRKEVADLSGDRAFHILPPLWTKEGKDINKDSRRSVPVEELYSITIEYRKQLGIKK